jgi:hypothetical protein
MGRTRMRWTGLFIEPRNVKSDGLLWAR